MGKNFFSVLLSPILPFFRHGHEVGSEYKKIEVSKERYYELYRQFLNHTISARDFHALMDWVSDPQNDAALKKYMEELWSEEEWDVSQKPRDWKVFRKQFQNASRQTDRVNQYRKVRPRIWIYAAAGVLLVLVSVALFIFPRSKVQLYSTAYGETREILLNDGSMVTLNANSTLEWNSNWSRSGERYARLDGEAYFDVAQTEAQDMFTVETNDLKVHVLGTTFNVSARRDQTDVTLETGKIELDLKESGEELLSMEPGDLVRYSSVVHKLEKTTVQSISESANWLDGVLLFEDVTVEEMFEEVEDQYGKTLISSDTNLLSRRMFTGIPYEDWPVAKEALELALGVKIVERDNELYVQ